MIEIGKKVEEPSLHRRTLQLLDRTRVVQYPGLKNILQMIGFRAIEPRRCWRIVDPGMMRAGVINHFVLNDLNAGAMGRINQFAQLRERAEVLFDGVEVLWVVAVKAGAWLIFL